MVERFYWEKVGGGIGIYDRLTSSLKHLIFVSGSNTYLAERIVKHLNDTAGK